MNYLSALASACALVLLSGTSPAQADGRKQDPLQHPFANPVDDPSLPRVLLVGDSISIGYTPRVRRSLNGEANVHRPTTNCRWSAFGLEHIDTWVGEAEWDVVHFNFGLWDWYGWSQEIKATPESYAASLEGIVTKLKERTDATLIFATTTPPCVGPEKKVKLVISEARAKEFNDAAIAVMKKHGVLVNDLGKAIGADREKYQLGADDVHYNEAGRDLLAAQVSETVRAAIAAPAARKVPLRLPNIFGDHMILQRDKPVRIWGWAGGGQEVSVTFAGQTRKASAGAGGDWQLDLDPMPANATGQVLTVTAGDQALRFEDVLVGEVWLCGGQSNMEWRLRSARDADVEIPSARYPGLRFIRIKPEGTPAPRDDFPAEDPDGVWQRCTPETIGDCSGVAYFFGQRLHRRLDVPVGLINAAWGGTMAQHWVTRETLDTLPAAIPYIEEYENKYREWIDGGREEGAARRFAADLEKWQARAAEAEAKGEKAPGGKPNERSYQDPAQGRIPAGAVNAMIMPIAGLSLRGALFYQGENNSFGDAWIPFRQTFPAVISDWRRLFRDEQMPFGIIQIAGWSTRRSMTYDMNHHTNVVREVQFNTWRKTPGTGLIVSFDANSNDSIHPGRKYPVGDRSARWALSTVYGITDAVRNGPLQWHGPVYESMEKKAGKIVVRFEEAGSAGLRLDRADARGFYIAGEDRIFHHAEARVTGGRGQPLGVEVWSDAVSEPVAVRYASSNLPLGTLMNGKELPAFPFRTDTWPLKPHYGETLYHVVPEEPEKP